MKKITLFLSISLLCQSLCGFSFKDCLKSTWSYGLKKPVSGSYSYVVKPVGSWFMSLGWKGKAATSFSALTTAIATYYVAGPAGKILSYRNYDKLRRSYKLYYCAYKQVLFYLEKVDKDLYSTYNASSYFSGLSKGEYDDYLYFEDGENTLNRDDEIDYNNSIEWKEYTKRPAPLRKPFDYALYSFDVLPSCDPNYYLFSKAGSLYQAVGETSFNLLSNQQKKDAKIILENHLKKLGRRLYNYFWALTAAHTVRTVLQLCKRS